MKAGLNYDFITGALYAAALMGCAAWIRRLWKNDKE